MPNYNTESLIVLAQPVINPVPEQDTPSAETVCRSDDKECLARWIQAYSDCE
jgi:hypothetical protein